MITRLASVLGIASVAAALSIPAIAQTATSDLHLVSANTELTHALNAKSIKQGDTVTAKLRSTVRLANGTELGRGSQLIGHIDQLTGSTQVVLTFDKAQLKDGKQIPIKATLTAIIPAGTIDYMAETPTATSTIDAVGGPVRLQSAVTAANSGTLSSKKDLHLPFGTQLEFAIAPSTDASNSANGN